MERGKRMRVKLVTPDLLSTNRYLDPHHRRRDFAAERARAHTVDNHMFELEARTRRTELFFRPRLRERAPFGFGAPIGDPPGASGRGHREQGAKPVGEHAFGQDVGLGLKRYVGGNPSAEAYTSSSSQPKAK